MWNKKLIYKYILKYMNKKTIVIWIRTRWFIYRNIATLMNIVTLGVANKSIFVCILSWPNPEISWYIHFCFNLLNVTHSNIAWYSSSTLLHIIHFLTYNFIIYDFCSQQRNQLTIQINNLQVDFDNVNARLEEESEAANSMRAQLSRANGDLTSLKSRYDKDILIKTEEFEDLRYREMGVHRGGVSGTTKWVFIVGASHVQGNGCLQRERLREITLYGGGV